MSDRRLPKFGLEEVVLHLIGPINPLGESKIDAKRLENLKDLTLLIDCLLYRVSNVATNSSRPEASMRKAGEHAKEFLEELKSADLP